MAEENQGVKPPPELPDQPLPRNYNKVLGENRATKTSWPELVGVTAEEAEKKIKEEMERAVIQVVPPDSFVTMDFNAQRVRLYVDESLNVAKPPTIG
ncbi:subtilisin inhibitor CLSI-I-like [Neltuma alba]|uniref:subtilisin inhibitor CLSI-I-like n=1 Tax=Neltuma alba TaxID=207710 RepID=UPI0010A2F07E|nr:subtilisin inhibitor CLSI-I-like [Prosopis alba]XP_028773010.1 subtilisin inhibitor CLSI-I-like [Prosopis alba]XP_028786688.1 subtilisin inhibitor CLSI-I-like [Prosopis alba]